MWKKVSCLVVCVWLDFFAFRLLCRDGGWSLLALVVWCFSRDQLVTPALLFFPLLHTHTHRSPHVFIPLCFYTPLSFYNLQGSAFSLSRSLSLGWKLKLFYFYRHTWLPSLMFSLARPFLARSPTPSPPVVCLLPLFHIYILLPRSALRELSPWSLPPDLFSPFHPLTP
ncbi:hypothetical protein BXZ70DRAFT_32846 [Cristinia sonorae]|uniref:Uncharacterized protein n=1 Tax=Cristinia sonorae TaxID=1940300 RepID=A0A8K0XUY0_9AGAR|nr:hypothetical protein BXZ70DRAFT_32846 [Cristinia sonorae]